MTTDELIEGMQAIVEIHSDFPMQVSPAERLDLLRLGKKYGGKLVLQVFQEWEEEKPGKPVRYFLQDFGEFKKRLHERYLDPQEYFGRMGQVATQPEAPDMEALRASRQEAGTFLGSLAEWLKAGRILAKIGGTAQTILKQLGVGRGDG